MRLCYADPPYIGMAKKRYGHAEVAHDQLIQDLTEFDGWALSCSSPSLRYLLPLCPDDTRVAAWVKPFHVFKKGVRPAYGWEPVLFHGGRQVAEIPPKGGAQVTPRDWHMQGITLRKGLVGAKPPEFCRWVLNLLGYQEGDELVALFPGTGVMGRVVAQGVLAI